MHADLYNLPNILTIRGIKYSTYLVNDFTRIMWVYFLHEKSQGFFKFVKCKVMVEKQSRLYLKALRTDRGGQFNSNEF